MHETVLMRNLIAIAVRKIEANHIGRVSKVTVSIGKLSNAMPNALLFAFEAMTQNGPLEGAVLEMKEIPVSACCDECGNEYKPENFPFICPSCGSSYYIITQGEDIYIESLECET